MMGWGVRCVQRVCVYVPVRVCLKGGVRERVGKWVTVCVRKVERCVRVCGVCVGVCL